MDYTLLKPNSVSYIILILILSMRSILCHSLGIAYSDHCSSFLPVPDSPTTERTDALSSFPLERSRNGYFMGQNKFFNASSRAFSNVLSLDFQDVYSFGTEGILKITAKVMIPSPYVYDHERSFISSILNMLRFAWRRPATAGGNMEFQLEGYWSEYSGNLCMVGFTRTKVVGVPVLKAVLRLDNIRRRKTIASLARGTLESLSSVEDFEYFKPLSVLIFPTIQENYAYTLVSEYDYDRTSDERDKERIISLDHLPRSSFCARPWWPPGGFYLEVARGCDPGKDCSPFSLVAGAVPKVMLIRGAGCLSLNQRLQVLLKFSGNISDGFNWHFNPSTTLIGEGYWDDKKLYVSACRFLDAEKSMATACVADCSTRLSLRFPAALSIRKNSNVVGKIWTNKSVSDPGYFRMIKIRSTENYLARVAGQKYQYTENDRVKNLCSAALPTQSNSGRYPDATSYDMKFDVEVRSSQARIALGYAIPFTVGNWFYEPYFSAPDVRSAYPAVPASRGRKRPTRISYKIGIAMLNGQNLGDANSLFATSSIINEKIEISAEGNYDENTGRLCMVGCRNVNATDQKDSMDCEILIKLQFPSTEEKLSTSYIKGSMESTRNEGDPLYFDQLEFSSASFPGSKASILRWRMDLKIVTALITSTLSCFFVGLQLLHVKRHPRVLPSISFQMLLLLTLGSVTQLAVNLGPFLLQSSDWNDLLVSGFRATETSWVFTGLADIAATVLQCRLLQLAIAARSKDENHKSLWFAEKASFIASLLFYASGFCFCILLDDWQGLDLESYAQLVTDSFLLPQILLNILGDSKERTLSRSFYIGITLLHLLVHVCNLYASDNPFRYDIFLPFWCLILAVVVYLQQRSRGGLAAPRKSGSTSNGESSVTVV